MADLSTAPQPARPGDGTGGDGQDAPGAGSSAPNPGSRRANDDGALLCDGGQAPPYRLIADLMRQLEDTVWATAQPGGPRGFSRR